MKIAVLSDNHGLLRPEAARVISECDAVIHGGDINSQKIIDEMKAAAKENALIYIVRGNNDKEWAEHLPHHLEFTLAGMNFYVVHINYKNRWQGFVKRKFWNPGRFPCLRSFCCDTRKGYIPSAA